MSPLLLLPSGCPSRLLLGSEEGTAADETTMAVTGQPSDDEIGAENAVPVAGNDVYRVAMDSPQLGVTAAAGVLLNDVDADGDMLLVAEQPGIITASGATVQLQTDGGFTYVPVATWWGQDAFEYTVVDGNGGEALGSVRVVVSPTAIPLRRVAEGIGGFALDGEAEYDASGTSVSEAGDVNGDGLGDLIVGASQADAAGYNSGRSYVVFGKTDTAAVQLSAVANGIGGFALDGASDYDYAGGSVSGAGDVNGDGLADLIVGADRTGPNGSGRSYVVFGKADTNAVLLSAVAGGIGGFPLDGAGSYEQSGGSVSNAGDVNGDGLADLIVGADRADANGNYNSGRSYVVFGKADTASVQLSAVADGIGGFVLDGEAESDYAGISVSGAGDVDGDGLADLIVGAYGADPNGESSGRAYVVFGKADTAAVALSAVTNGIGGFVLDGAATYDDSGLSVSGAGDVNGDGLGDLIVGAVGADPNGSGSGRSYVVFGKADTAAVVLSAVASGAGGFALDGAAAFDLSGVSVSGAGDVDGDGLADVIVGSVGAEVYSGRSYVVFGKADTGTVLLSAVASGMGGFALDGEATYDYAGASVSGAGDVNGDGFADVIVGALGASPNGEDSGRSYVVFGGDFTLSAGG